MPKANAASKASTPSTPATTRTNRPLPERAVELLASANPDALVEIARLVASKSPFTARLLSNEIATALADNGVSD